MNNRFVTMTAAGALVVGMMLPDAASAAQRPAIEQTVRLSTKTVTIGAISKSGVTGHATFSYNPQTRLTTVRLTVWRLTVNSVHPAAIRSGHCGQNGAILYPFGKGYVRAGKNGSAVATTTFKQSYAGRQLYVGIQQGPSAVTRTGRRTIACGNLM